ncbi:MAG: 50S ribosomal protein L28 [Planctomycetaceae bacterium]|nr:50S ribosomal protein L28 [Planctomycetaceae bacterium]
MARVCEICGKGRSVGNSIETRGKAKYLGGVGTKVTGITRRVFLPNLQNVRTTTANGTTKTVRVCTQCVRSGAVRKQVKNAPFKVAHDTVADLAAKAVVAKPAVAKKPAVKKPAVKKATKK